MPLSKPKAKIGWFTATTLVAANMIGTGVFTSLGFQIASLPHGFTIIMLWLIGGLTALTGALAYGEIGATLPRSGGEYHFLSTIYHPAIGFMAGWISLLAGFSAPISAAAIAAGEYTTRVLTDTGLLPAHLHLLAMRSLAIALALSIMWVHLKDLHTIGRFQRLFTALKISLIVVLIVLGFLLAKPQSISFLPHMAAWGDIFSGSFAIALVFVMYSYSGWNASAYIAEEIHQPGKNLPRSLFWGTLVVMLLYIPVNAVFLYSTPTEAMVNQEEVGYIAARFILGPTGGLIMGGLIALGLISAISSMTWAGPRVMQVIGQDTWLLQFLAKENRHGIPYVAVITQTAIAVVMIITSTFETVIYYMGFLLTLSSWVTVLGLFRLRLTHSHLPRPYRTWGYPVTPFVYLLVTGWMLFYLIQAQPRVAIIGLATLLAGGIIYWLNQRIQPHPPKGRY